MRLAGIDGCSSGWVAVVAEAGDHASARLSPVTDLHDFLAEAEIDFALVDIPIGFPDGPSSRDVEPAMRARLGGKASSVFPVPCRMALAEPVYADASFVNEQALGKRLPKQSFMLFPKMIEIDRIVRAVGQNRLREGHPETSFAAMAKAPVLTKKRKPEGQADRQALIEREGLPARSLLASLVKGRMAVDDVLDAAALLWSAERYRRGQHESFPPIPSRDRMGLEMSVIA